VGLKFVPSGRETLPPGADIRPVGDDLLSISVDDPQCAQALATELRNRGDWCEAVAGIDSVVIQFDNASIDLPTALQRVRRAVDELPPATQTQTTSVEIPVCYGGDYGPDLDAVCEQLALSPVEFIARHTGTDYPVEMLGFVPGFAYIGGLDAALNVPRRSKPRLRVAAGSVGIADGRTGLYSLPGPGGWLLVGRTPEMLFDVNASTPFLLGPGMRVRFRAISAGEFDRLRPA
jgi:inhibitor of KinA